MIASIYDTLTTVWGWINLLRRRKPTSGTIGGINPGTFKFWLDAEEARGKTFDECVALYDKKMLK